MGNGSQSTGTKARTWSSRGLAGGVIDVSHVQSRYREGMAPPSEPRPAARPVSARPTIVRPAAPAVTWSVEEVHATPWLLVHEAPHRESHPGSDPPSIPLSQERTPLPVRPPSSPSISTQTDSIDSSPDMVDRGAGGDEAESASTPAVSRLAVVSSGTQYEAGSPDAARNAEEEKEEEEEEEEERASPVSSLPLYSEAEGGDDRPGLEGEEWTSAEGNEGGYVRGEEEEGEEGPGVAHEASSASGLQAMDDVEDVGLGLEGLGLQECDGSLGEEAEGLEDAEDVSLGEAAGAGHSLVGGAEEGLVPEAAMTAEEDLRAEAAMMEGGGGAGEDLTAEADMMAAGAATTAGEDRTAETAMMAEAAVAAEEGDVMSEAAMLAALLEGGSRSHLPPDAASLMYASALANRCARCHCDHCVLIGLWLIP